MGRILGERHDRNVDAANQFPTRRAAKDTGSDLPRETRPLGGGIFIAAEFPERSGWIVRSGVTAIRSCFQGQLPTPKHSPGKFEKLMEKETKSKENTRSCPIAHKSFGVIIDRMMELKSAKTSPEN